MGDNIESALSPSVNWTAPGVAYFNSTITQMRLSLDRFSVLHSALTLSNPPTSAEQVINSLACVISCGLLARLLCCGSVLAVYILVTAVNSKARVCRAWR